MKFTIEEPYDYTLTRVFKGRVSAAIEADTEEEAIAEYLKIRPSNPENADDDRIEFREDMSDYSEDEEYDLYSLPEVVGWEEENEI